jgi:hypothetical protein
MGQQTLTLTISDELYNRIKRRADESGSSIEETAASVLAAATPTEKGMTPELEQMLDGMALLDDEALWRAARNDLARQASEERRRLRAKRERKGLSDAEKQRMGDLLDQYERGILIRAEAAALLKQRGHDVDVLLQRV